MVREEREAQRDTERATEGKEVNDTKRAEAENSAVTFMFMSCFKHRVNSVMISRSSDVFLEMQTISRSLRVERETHTQ